MDPITHGLAAATIYNLGFKRKAAFWVLLIASVAPDFDYVTRFWGADVFLRYHRGITHGVFALLIAPLVIGVMFGYRKGFLYYTFLAFIAYAAHLFMDLLNQYGTRILSPFDWNQYSLDLMFIFDPYITFGLLLSVIICRINRQKTVAVALITVLLLGAYTGGRYYLRDRTKEFIKSKMDANIYRVFPLPNDFLRWWFIAKSGNEIKVGFADLFSGRICEQETYKLSERDPFIAISKETGVVRNFLYFARYPYAEVKRGPDRITVIWRELAYSFLPGDHFVAVVIYGSDGKVMDSYFKY